MEASLLAVISLAISISTLLVVFWQTYLLRQALQFQAYLNIESSLHESGPGISPGNKALNSLPKYTDYKTFAEMESLETQQVIQYYVSMLNIIAHLVSEGFINKYQVWGRYFVAYKLCYEKLYPWYIEGVRNTNFRGNEIAYATFEAMCLLVAEADKSEAVKRKLMKRQVKHLGRNVNVAFKKLQMSR